MFHITLGFAWQFVCEDVQTFIERIYLFHPCIWIKICFQLSNKTINM